MTSKEQQARLLNEAFNVFHMKKFYADGNVRWEVKQYVTEDMLNDENFVKALSVVVNTLQGKITPLKSPVIETPVLPSINIKTKTKPANMVKQNAKR
ncbi:MAG: hypothetical protein ACYCZQ_03220 [Burkholderiales bacterium]